MIPIFVDSVLRLVVSIRFFLAVLRLSPETARMSSNDNKRFCDPHIILYDG